MALIALHGVSKIYRAGDVLVPALRDVDLEIERGELLSIVGASGSGKSTLMNILGCLDRPTRGVYALAGHDVSHLSDDQLALVRNRLIGFIFQSFNLLPRLSALEQVMVPLVFQGASDRRRRALIALHEMGLSDRVHHKPTQLSGGQQQRVAVARALVTQPAIILADEPTGALDSRTAAELMDTFVRLNKDRGITIAFVTHDANVAAYTDRVIELRDGEIVSDARSDTADDAPPPPQLLLPPAAPPTGATA